MNVLLFASDSHYFEYLSPIYKKLVEKNHRVFFLYTKENTTQYPTINMGKYNFSCNFEYNFEDGISSKSLGLPIPFEPDYVLLARDRWQPEQSIIYEFKTKFNSKIALIELNSQFSNVIESRLEAISRTKHPQNLIDLIFDHSKVIQDTRKQALDWDKWKYSYIVGNPCYDDLDIKIKSNRNEVYKKYNIDETKKQILFFGLINMDRFIAFNLLENLSTKINHNEYQILYKPYPGEPYGDIWKNDFYPQFRVNNVQVIYDHLDLFPLYDICDIHIGVLSSVMYPSLFLNKKVVNINNFCTYLDKGNDIEFYKNENYKGGGADGSAKFWMEVHNLKTLEEFESLVNLNKLKQFKTHNQHIKSLITTHTYNYDFDLNFLTDNTFKDYSELLMLFDEYNDNNASDRIVNILQNIKNYEY